MRRKKIIYSITVLLIISSIEIKSGFLSLGQKIIPFTKKYAIATVSSASAFILFWILNKKIFQNPILRYNNLQKKLAHLNKQKAQLEKLSNQPASKKTGLAFQLNREKSTIDIDTILLLTQINTQIALIKDEIEQLKHNPDFLRSYSTPPYETLKQLMGDAAEKRLKAATTPATKQ